MIKHKTIFGFEIYQHSFTWLLTIATHAYQWSNLPHVFHGRSSSERCSFQIWSSPLAFPQNGRRALKKFIKRKGAVLNISAYLHFLVINWTGQWLNDSYIKQQCWPTNGADDASVACGGGFGVDVKQAHVFQESVSHGSVKLLLLNEGRAHVWLCLRHGAWWYNGSPAK